MLIHLATPARYLPEKTIRKLAARHARGLFGWRNIAIKDLQLMYKPFYFLKILAKASRCPFKPKRVGYVVYFDAVLGRGGLTDGVPRWDTVDVEDSLLWEAACSPESFRSRQAELLEKFVLRRYLLKRPELRCEGEETVYLPYQLCTYADQGREYRIVLNAETGNVNT